MTRRTHFLSEPARLSVLIPLLGLVAPLAAQKTVQAEWKTVTELNAQAGVSVLGAPSKLALGTDLKVARSFGKSESGASASCSFNYSQNGPAAHSFRVQMSGSAPQCQSCASSASVYTEPRHQWMTRIRLSSPRPVQGLLRIRAATTTSNGPTAAGLVDVDVGDDKRLELSIKFAETKSVDVPITVDASGVDILTRMSESVSGNFFAGGGFTGALDVDFVPFPRTITYYGLGCGPWLTGTVTRAGNVDTLTFQLRYATPNALVVQLLGSAQLNVRFPGTSCALYTNPVFLDAFVADAGGNATRQLAIPANLQVLFFAQHLTLAPGPSLAIASSHGAQVE